MTQAKPSIPASQMPDTNRDAFVARLKQVVGEESIRSFARRSGISDTFLRQCLTGKSEPTRPILVALAHAGGVSIAWLACGEGNQLAG